MDTKVFLTLALVYLAAVAVTISLVWIAKSKSAKATVICFGIFIFLLMGAFIIFSLNLLLDSPLILKFYLGVMPAFFVAGLIFSVFIKPGDFD
jgi:hypothetical protein